MTPRAAAWRARLRLLLPLTAVLAAALLFAEGYAAVREWRAAVSLVATRRADETATLVATALERDMRGAHVALGTATVHQSLASDDEADRLMALAGLFARFPYMDSAFVWSSRLPMAPPHWYARPERRPAWMTPNTEQTRFPVTVGRADIIAPALQQQISRDLQQGRRTAVFATQAGASRHYEGVAVPIADGNDTAPLVAGFLVDTAWAREVYLGDLVTQVARIVSRGNDIAVALRDEHDVLVSSGDVADAPQTVRRRPFTVAFFDPSVIALDPPRGLDVPQWHVVTAPRFDPAMDTAARGGRRTLRLASLMGIALCAALFVSWRALRAAESFAALRADFVSAVTHELKTPLTNLQAICESLTSGRTTPAAVAEYGTMGLGEARRLSRLVDNLLEASRVTDVTSVYQFTSVPLAAVVDRSVGEFVPVLTRDGFTVTVTLPDDLPPVKADAAALGLMLNNLIDNAIRYAGDGRHIAISATAHRQSVTLVVRDTGVGIPDEDLARVTHRFFRGRRLSVEGSGLGLTIVDRIVRDHGGRLFIRSTVGTGTTVSVTLPTAATA